MTELLLIGLAVIIILGIAGQWISWYFKLPSILLLLVFGIIIGPVTGLLNPDEFFGELLFPFISLSVAIILFEGGLSLKIDELKPVIGPVRNLITIGIVLTWGLVALSAVFFMGMDTGLALLVGAILVVTGPTVIIPLLRLVKPKGQINSILKWEGIINDPIGAILALLVFEIIVATGPKEATLVVIIVILKTVLISSIIGLFGAYILVKLIKKDYIPDYLQNPASLALLILVFASANTVQSESGLLAVTLMGIYLANQKQIVVEHIVEFKENLGVLLLSTLFIVLSARLKISDLELIDSGVILFLIVLIVIIRPVTIFLSTIKSSISWKEKLYLSWMAPRGIVAAAVASIFSLELAHEGYAGSEVLVPLMFLVIIVTIGVYGLSAIPLARTLNLSEYDPQGILIAGINKLSIEIHNLLQNYGIRVLLVDNNWEKVTNARRNGAESCFGSIVSDKTQASINLEGIGRFIALTSNKGINSLSVIHYSKLFDSANVYQINTAPKFNQQMIKELRGNFFSSERLTSPELEKYENKFILKANKITEEFKFDNVIAKYPAGSVHPLFTINSENSLSIFSEKNSKSPGPGDTVINLILGEADN